MRRRLADLQEQVTGLESGPPAVWGEIRDGLGRARAAAQANDRAALDGELDKLETLAATGVAGAYLWGDLFTALATVSRLVEVECARQVAEQLPALIRATREMVDLAASDEVERAELRRRVEELFAFEGSWLKPHAS